MVAADHFDENIFAGIGPGQAGGGHGRFGSAADKADFLDGRIGRTDPLGQFDFAFGGGAVGGTLCGGLLDSRDDRRVGMAQNHRAPGTDVIDVFVAVDIPDMAAAGRPDKDRAKLDFAERAHGRIDPAGDDPAGPFIGRLRMRTASCLF